MLDAYLRIATPVTVRFSLTGLLARLPISMQGLGLVILTEAETGSYGVAGAVAAVAVIANAVLALNQSYSYNGQSNCASQTAGSQFTDSCDSIRTVGIAATNCPTDERACD